MQSLTSLEQPGEKKVIGAYVVNRMSTPAEVRLSRLSSLPFGWKMSSKLFTDVISVLIMSIVAVPLVLCLYAYFCFVFTFCFCYMSSFFCL